MANKIVKQYLGAFAEGAIPTPIIHVYTDFEGTPIDVSGFDVRQMNIEATPKVNAELGEGEVQFTTDGTDGSVTYFWTGEDMAKASDYEAQIWVSNGTQRYESDLLLYKVYNGPGEAP